MGGCVAVFFGGSDDDCHDDCDGGWFGGGCQFLCHCADGGPCNRTSGACEDGCGPGWFGPACQYESLSYRSHPHDRDLHWLRDNDERTCNDGNDQSITVTLDTPRPLTWLRLVMDTDYTVSTDAIELNYRPGNSPKEELRTCSHLKRAQVDKRTVDISCRTTDVVKQFTLKGAGVGSLCSLYISGGRNVALKGNAEQSSQIDSAGAGKAVDGNDGTRFDENITYRTSRKARIVTKSYPNQWWNLTFHRPAVEINEIRVYNRPDDYKGPLRGFSLYVHGRNSSTVLSYTDKNQSSQRVYTIVPQPKITQPVLGVEIKKREDSPTLTLCEVMVLGDSACPPGKFGRECERDCNCVDQENDCFVSTGGCPSGCAAGYTGEDCWTPCPNGTYGDDCALMCNPQCSGPANSCHHVNGSCDMSCDPGFKPFPDCTEECGQGTYGPNCVQDCSPRCLNNECDHVTGQCQQCGPGYRGGLCDLTCLNGTYGLGCNNTCNEHCSGIDNACNHTDGSCEVACDPGYLPFPQCTQVCSAGTYGQACNETCSTRCYDGICHHVTGKCDKCASGLFGESCDQECPSGFYGQNCDQTCSSGCLHQHCDHVTGICIDCVSGYSGTLCDKKCPNHTYGENCVSNCSGDCLDNFCDHVTGACHKCVPGKTGELCALPSAESSANSKGVDISVISAAGGGAVVLIVAIVILIVFIWSVKSRGRVKQRATTTGGAQRESSGSDPGVAEDVQLQVVCEGGGSDASYQADVPHAQAEGGKDDCPESVYLNVPPRNTAVAVEDLKAYLHKHATDSFFKDQFESMPMANDYGQTHGQTEENKNKNRYKNIVPYDHSRVLLLVDEEKDQQDYFNASFVKGYTRDEWFIASQAPNDLILHDFIRMLWEQKVDRIIMLTNLVEMSKIKCTAYWPSDGVKAFGEITVKLVSNNAFAEYTVRHLELSKDGDSPRHVTHFHFTAWPDKLVPDSPWGLVNFQQRVLASPGSGPLLVHCSAGVGRTGTFIALCHLLQEAEATGKMDFLSTLWRLRQDRMHMIQTVAALLAHVTSGTGFHARDIREKLDALQEGKETSKTGYQTEFEAATMVYDEEPGINKPNQPKGRDDQDAINATGPVSKQKNRLGNILPKEAHRPNLKCESKEESSYINAVLVPTLTKNRQDILTQLPLPSTVTDFWRLVTQYNVGLVVAFEAESRHTDETVGQFLPQGDGASVTDSVFEVEARETETTHLWQEFSVTVSRKTKADTDNSNPQQPACKQNVTCLLSKSTTTEPKTAIELVKKVKSCKQKDRPRVVYMCRNGADYSGLLCVQSILLDRMDVDQRLTVPLVVGALKAIRPQVIPTVEQYICLYKVLDVSQDFRDDVRDGVYANI